ncbi:MAG: AMP-binding protein, partial [Alphaproteobacteria bacterium]
MSSVATLSSLARRAGHAARALLARRHGALRAEELPFLPWESAYPPGVDWHAAIPTRPVFDLLDDSAARFPDHRCIDFLGKDYSYREVHALADRAAKGFQALGLGKGARVALFLPNSPYYVIAYYGALKAGCVAVNANPLYAERGLVHVLADSEAEVVVTLDEPALYRKLAHALPLTRVRKVVVCPVAEALPFLKGALWPFLRMKDRVEIPRDSRHVGFRELIENDGRFEPVEIRPHEDLAALQYTGGIDGRAKGAMLSHANLYANATQTAMWVSGLERGRERILAVLPFTHAFGMTVAMNTSIHIGAELVVLPRFEPGAVLRAIERRRVTLLTGVPAMFGALGAHRKLDRHDVSSVKLCVSGGAPLTAAVRRRFERPTGLTILEGYG